MRIEPCCLTCCLLCGRAARQEKGPAPTATDGQVRNPDRCHKSNFNNLSIVISFSDQRQSAELFRQKRVTDRALRVSIRDDHHLAQGRAAVTRQEQIGV